MSEKLKQELGRIDLGEDPPGKRRGWLASVGRFFRRQILRSTSTRR